MIPKFRAWDDENKVMWNIERWHIEDEYFDLIEPNKSVVDLNAKRTWRKQRDTILMQSTGLFDINDKEIFEGDVVASTWFKDYGDLVGYSKLGKVIYRNGCFCIEYPGDVEKGYTPTILDFAINVEIIGNIFENPELLEGVEDDT